MSGAIKKRYMQLLAKEIVAMYGLSLDVVHEALKNSALNQLIDERPEYVDHVPLSNWAEEVHAEMLQ